MKELDVVRMKEAYGNIPKGEKGTIVHVYTNEPGVVEVEFSNRERFEEVETIPVFKLERV